MSWGLSFLIALLVALIGTFAAGFAASGAVEWLRIPAREGEAGYFIVFMGLGGILAGFVIGFVVSQLAGGPGFGGFARGFGVSAAVMVAVAGAGAFMAWLQNDPVPKIAGHEVRVEIELRSYPGFDLVVPETNPELGYQAPLYASLGAYGRESRLAPLDFRAAREEDGRWIVPGHADLFTSMRDLYFGMWADQAINVYVPFNLPRPLQPSQEWSAWLTAPADEKAPKETGPEGFAIRYRLALEPLDGQ